MQILKKIKQAVRQAIYILLLAMVTGLGFNYFHSNGIPLRAPQHSLSDAILSPDSSGLGTDREPQLISTEAAFRLFEARTAIFLDARKPEHYEFGHIPGARLLTWTGNETPPALPANLNYGQEIVVYCSDPGCEMAVELAYFLAGNGFRNISIFEGGWDAWSAANYPIETGMSQ